MTFYELLLFLHVAASIIWLGAGFLVAVLVLGAVRAGDRQKEALHHRDVGWLAPRLFIPASLATLVVGILLVIEGTWSFDELWIVIAFVAWAIAFGLGFFYFRPEGERIGALVAAEGPGSVEAERRVHRLNVVDRLQLALLFVVVADMVMKPTGDDGAILAAGGAILLALVAFGVLRIRSGPPTSAVGSPAPAGAPGGRLVS